MPCRNAVPFLREAVASVLCQPECLELLVADGGSSDGSLQLLQELAALDSRVRLVSRSDTGPADALNQAFHAARGTLIAWLNADDLYPPGALARAVAALAAHPRWLMVYGEGEEFDLGLGLRQRYPTLPPSCGVKAFRSHCFLCQPTVVFRRTMAVLLGPFDQHWRTAFDFDFWLRAFAAFPHRIGYLPHLQGRTRLHDATITSQQRSRVALEASALIAREFGASPVTRLHNYALELQLGIAALPAGVGVQEHLDELTDHAEPWLEPEALNELRQNWLLDPKTASVQLAAEQEAAALALPSLLPVRLLQALHPELLLDAPGPPTGPHLRLQEAVQQCSSAYPVLRGVSGSTALGLFTERPFGVNLIGHAFEVFGIGEDIRMATRALEAAGVPCCVIHHPAANGATCIDRSLEPLLCLDPAGGPYAFNLICMAAPIQARWLLQAGLDPLRERYTLASWPWETQQWPKAWLPLLEVADELTPSSVFTAAALQEPAAAAAMHLQVMPMAAEVPDPDRFCGPSARQAARVRHGLPQEAVLFGYGFDLNSTAIRKNPMGALEAFQLAFPLPHLPATFGREINNHPLSNQVALMIKSFPPQAESAEWHWLQLRAAEDPRIHLVVASLERDELLALYGSCDVFLSLHRSEGFGRGMAEALQLGVDVIATAYGGNTDFCTGPLAHPVRCQEVPIPRGAYPCADGHVWGEPDLDHAAELMQQVAARRLALANDHEAAAADPSRDPSVLAGYRQRFSWSAAGARYRARLEELWGQRQELAGRLKWRADTPV
jgi:hypothetical protein